MKTRFLIAIVVFLCAAGLCSCSGTGRILNIPKSREITLEDLTGAASEQPDMAATGDDRTNSGSEASAEPVAQTEANDEAQSPENAQSIKPVGRDEEIQTYLDYVNANFGAIAHRTEGRILSLVVDDLGGDSTDEMILVYLPDDDGSEEGPSVNIDIFTLTEQGSVRLLDRLEYSRGYMSETEVSLVDSPEGKLLYITQINAGSHGSDRSDEGYAFSGGSQLEPVFLLGYSSHYTYSGQGDFETASAYTMNSTSIDDASDMVPFAVFERENGALVYSPDTPNVDSELEVTQAYYDMLSRFNIRESFTPGGESDEPNTYIDRWELPVTDGRTQLAAVRHSYSGPAHATQDYTGFETHFYKDAEGHLHYAG